METQIPPSYYHDPLIFRREQEQLFAKTWNCVGITSQIANHNDFICRDIAGRSVVVHNFHGKLRAFHNVCSHRLNRIHPTGTGNRPFQCDYHGWIYDDQGLPSSIPKRPRFDDLTADKLCSLRLTHWRVETCGQMIFVCCSADRPNLQDYLGNAAATVEAMSNACGPLVDRNEMTIKANWKILVENTLESYHVGFIHPNTFAKLNVGDGCFGWQPPHSSWEGPLGAKIANRMVAMSSLFEGRQWRTAGYFHQLVFPNLTLASTQGTTFSLQFFEPVSPGITSFTSLVFQAKLPSLGTGAQSAVNALNSSVASFNRAVFSEDKDVCENVQRGAYETDKPGILSDEEERVGAFQIAYMNVIDSK